VCVRARVSDPIAQRRCVCVCVCVRVRECVCVRMCVCVRLSDPIAPEEGCVCVCA
jgi:hypothetical protein